MILLKDLELIKQLTIKEFDHFTDHLRGFDENMDQLFGNALFNLRGDKWRDMRTTLSPAFTASKMRMMFRLMLQVADNMIENIGQSLSQGLSKDYEIKDFCSRFTNDIIALCAFGIEVDSMRDQTNQFYVAGKKINDFVSPKLMLKFFAYKVCPPLAKLLGLQMFDARTKDFFRRMVTESMAHRKANNIQSPDMISLLMEAQRESNYKWSDDEIVAQCFLFFFAGFESVSAAMSMACYELAINPEIQEKLLDEIRSLDASLDGEPLTYEAIKGMKYMDQVVSEVLRKYPVVQIDRSCVKELDFDDGKGFAFKFEKGTLLNIPIHAIHHDPQYFPQPAQFDPERFGEAEKHKFNADAYMPFGLGPRNCIGSRFALMEIKLLLVILLRIARLEVITKTQIPLVFKNGLGGLLPKNGIWIGLKAR